MRRPRAVFNVNEDTVEKTTLHFVSQGRHDLQDKQVVKGKSRLELDCVASHYFGNQGVVSGRILHDLHKSTRREVEAG